jgi:hypothetical protein
MGPGSVCPGPQGPTAEYQAHWQFVFPATRWSKDPATNRWGRAHLSPSATQRKVKVADRAARDFEAGDVSHAPTLFSRRRCCVPATMSERCRSSWGIGTFEQP